MAMPEQLGIWLARGRTPEAVAAYGLSIESIKRVIRENKIPCAGGAGSLFSWQERLVEGGKSLYYALPFVEKIQSIRPDIAQTITEPLKGDSNLITSTFSDRSVRHSLLFYAFADTLAECFHAQTGLWWNYRYIANTAAMLFPELVVNDDNKGSSPYSGVTDLGGIDPWDLDEEKWHTGLAKVDMSVKQLRDVFSQCLQRRGGILYYSPEILKHQILPGYESEREIMVVAGQPIDTSVILGIEMLSDADRTVLNRLFQGC